MKKRLRSSICWFSWLRVSRVNFCAHMLCCMLFYKLLCIIFDISISKKQLGSNHSGLFFPFNACPHVCRLVWSIDMHSLENVYLFFIIIMVVQCVLDTLILCILFTCIDMLVLIRSTGTHFFKTKNWHFIIIIAIDAPFVFNTSVVFI